MYIVVGDYINPMKYFRFQVFIYIKLLHRTDTHKHRSQEKLSIKKGSF